MPTPTIQPQAIEVESIAAAGTPETEQSVMVQPAQLSKPRSIKKDKQRMSQTTQEAPQPPQTQDRQKTANVSFFKGGANIFGPAANLIAASIEGVELKETAKKTAYVTLNSQQIARAIAIVKTNDYQVVRQSRQPRENWEHTHQAEVEATAKEAPTQEAPATEAQEKAPRNLDLETVIQSNIELALKNPECDLLKTDIVAVNAELGSVRIDKGGKEDGKGKMVFGMTRNGDIYAARKDMAVEGGQLQMAEGENVRPAMIYQVSKEGQVKVNRMAEANQLLPQNRQMDFSKVAQTIRDNTQAIAQQAVSTKPAPIKKKDQIER